MSQATIAQALEQLEQLYTMRLLHQTLRERLEQAQDVAFSFQTFRRDTGDDNAMTSVTSISPSTVMDIFRLPQQLEDMMMMRAIALSLQQVQPSTAPPPITPADSDSLEKVTLSFDVIQRLCKNEYSECPICQEEFKRMKGRIASRLPCDHVFCVKCIDQWLQSSRTCPVCRLELVGVHELYQSSPTKRKSIVCITPPPSSPVARPGSRPFARTVAIRSSNVDEDEITPTTNLFSYRQEGVGSTAQRIPPRIQQVPAAATPLRTSTPSSESEHDDEDDDDSTNRPVHGNSGHQALLDEIMQRRDEQRERIAPRAAPPLVVATTPSAPASTATPNGSAVRVPPRLPQSDARPVPPVQNRSKSNVSSIAATPVVGRVRPAGRGSNPPVTSTVRATGQQQGSVGVRGLLNRRAQSNS